MKAQPTPQFNALCSVAERFMPSVRRLLERAALFVWPHQQTCPTVHDEEERAFLTETFFLPFPVVAIEDDISCVVLADTMDKQVGLNTQRTYVDCLCREKTITVTLGTFSTSFSGDTMMEIAGVMDVFAIVQDGALALTTARLSMDQRREFLGYALKNAKTAVEELFALNTPSRFVVENAPATPPKGRAKIARGDQRPQYTLLTPGEIHAVLGTREPDGAHASPTAHYRRRHYRTLQSPRFTKKQGQTIVVPACWVGPSEAEAHGRHYRVRLDL